MSNKSSKGPAIVAVAAALAVLGVLGVYATQNPGERRPDPAQQRELQKPPAEAPSTEDVGAQATAALNNALSSMSNIPSGARVNGVNLAGGLATVDFTPEIQKGYGSAEEAELINKLLGELAAYDQIQKATFSVNGQPLESLGHLELLEPVDVREGV
jgi:hemolysin activation/secretion protein